LDQHLERRVEMPPEQPHGSMRHQGR